MQSEIKTPFITCFTLCKKTCPVLYGSVVLPYYHLPYYVPQSKHRARLSMKASFCNPLPFPQNKQAFSNRFDFQTLWRKSPLPPQGS